MQSTFKNIINLIITPLKLWLTIALLISLMAMGFYVFIDNSFPLMLLIIPVATLAAGLPALVAFIVLFLLKKFFSTNALFFRVLVILCLFISVLYGAALAFPLYDLYNHFAFINWVLLCISAMVSASVASVYLHRSHISGQPFTSIKINNMEIVNQAAAESSHQSNRLWIKGAITAALILLMMIPVSFVSQLVHERSERQQEVKNEVSSKWAGEQSITFPYLYIPYTINRIDKGKNITETRSFFVLPENLNVSGNVSTEKRQRSIYSVLLYNSDVSAKGNFNIVVPAGVDTASVNWSNAKICFGLSDFKGIQQKPVIKINGKDYDLSAGLPASEIDTTGLSADVPLSATDMGKNIAYDMNIKIKGSDQLHFNPLAGNSRFTLTSGWGNPSFDGNILPSERRLNNAGFEAVWSFNKANLPFNTALKNFSFKKSDYAFGVSLLQPADQYAKTLRCMKYAILFIGLTFSLFFIVEVMQKQPFHPVQYVLVGMALVVFFTLLLSISEFLLFDVAYLIAAAATVSLITLYAKSHFKSWKIAGVFAGTIASIYGFIFVLIRLEDTALLAGSIGLFIILSLAMYASRKINWYGRPLPQNISM